MCQFSCHQNIPYCILLVQSKIFSCPHKIPILNYTMPRKRLENRRGRICDLINKILNNVKSSNVANKTIKKGRNREETRKICSKKSVVFIAQFFSFVMPYTRKNCKLNAEWLFNERREEGKFNTVSWNRIKIYNF